MAGPGFAVGAGEAAFAAWGSSSIAAVIAETAILRVSVGFIVFVC